MSNSVIQLSVQTDHSYSAGELRDPVSKATIEFFDSFEPSPGSTKIAFSSSDGLDPKNFRVHRPLGLVNCDAFIRPASVTSAFSRVLQALPALIRHCLPMQTLQEC